MCSKNVILTFFGMDIWLYLIRASYYNDINKKKLFVLVPNTFFLNSCSGIRNYWQIFHFFKIDRDFESLVIESYHSRDNFFLCRWFFDCWFLFNERWNTCVNHLLTLLIIHWTTLCILLRHCFFKTGSHTRRSYILFFHIFHNLWNFYHFHSISFVNALIPGW